MKQFLKINTVFLIVFCAAAMQAQNTHNDLRQADKAYEANNIPMAEAGYRKALSKDSTSTKGNYNLGNTTYLQKQYDEAIKRYQTAAESAKDRASKARAYHNLGNALYQKGDYKQSVEAYKNALRQNPNDLDTKRNLANAMRRLPPQPPKQQDQQNQNKKNKDQKNQKPQSGDQPLDKPQPNKKPEDQPSKEQKEAGGKGQNLSKDEAQQLLDIMEQEEQKVQQKLKKAQARKRKSTKDW